MGESAARHLDGFGSRGGSAAGRYLTVAPERVGMTDERTRAHVFVTGRVQGVYYRASTRDAARERNLDGWVKNLDDGRVEAVFEGPEGDVEEVVEWCHTGSDAAEVESVDVEYGDPEGESGFQIEW
ncbi:acylphosphatase [Halogeometricum pallidum JCM 14848]|uniref:acylphosphatase n=2 Tax=Halogeometricum TaxID=60846 RepID=M0CS30_HALPD|nr:acylphosphatase [Halogeometricum pallidum JCM 14848]